MKVLRRLIAADEAQETRFFLVLAVFGFVVAAIYWFVSYETAGTILLAGFGLATAIIATRLAADPVSQRLRRGVLTRSYASAADAARPHPEAMPETDASGGGTGGIDRPFGDESGRLPDATIAPFAVGLGVAVAATGLVFGPAPVIVGLLPLAWGAWTWLAAAGDELVATTTLDDRQ
jgi:hypothetical protein